ncbi:MAG TPA: O-antigen ligase family protein [Candidatus Limnocylindrales bacterium]|nr:O-antigen ligase family protein [Candidatus Limnocylindrales bacterium]
MGTTISRGADASRAQIIVLVVGFLVLLAGATLTASSGAGALAILLAGGALGAYGIVRYPFLGVVVYLITFLFTYPEPLRGSGNFTINNLLGMVLLPMLLFGTLKDGFGWFWRARPLVFLLVALAILLSSGVIYNRTIGTGDDEQTMEERKGMSKELYGARKAGGELLVRTRDPRVKIVTRYVFLLFFVFFVRTPRQLKVIVGLLLSVLLMSYLNLSSEAGELGWGKGRLRVVGEAGTGLYTGTNPNKLAFYILLCGVFLWYMRTRVRSFTVWLAWLAGFAGCMIALPMTGSRSGFLGILLFLGITLLEGRFSYRKLIGLALATMVVVVQMGYDVNFLDYLLPSETSQRITRIAGSGDVLAEGQTAEGSFQKRAQKFFETAANIQYAPLLGVGLENYPIVQQIIDPSGMGGPPHNSYLWAAVEGGLVTLGLYLAMYIWTLRQLNGILRDYEGRFGPVDLRWLVNAMRTLVVMFLFFSFFADIWVHIYFYVIMGLSLAVIQLHRTYAETGHVPGTAIGASGSATA